MLRFVLWLTCLCVSPQLFSQSGYSVYGIVFDYRTHKVLPRVSICADDCSSHSESGKEGRFLLQVPSPGVHDLKLTASGYRSMSITIDLLPGSDLDLGRLYLEPDNVQEGITGLMDTAPDVLADDAGLIADFTPLNALRDNYQNRSAFNYSQAFYRVRGYDSKYHEVSINGISMNEAENGRAAYTLWGGLNDMFREQEVATGLTPLKHTFGGVGGSSNYTLQPSLNRRGFRVSTSVSNRMYGGRIMATYNSGMNSKRLAYSLSASRRWAEEGYAEGTLYDAMSFFASLQFELGTKGSLIFNAFYAPRRLGGRSALTREVVSLAGPRYNSFWGNHGGEKRNSRVKHLKEPVFLLNYLHSADQGFWQFGVLYKRGSRSAGRLGYFNAPNPDPTYYRYLPSYYLNANPVNYENARLAKEAFLSDPQLDWEGLFKANTSPSAGGQAGYLLYDDQEQARSLVFSMNTTYRLGAKNELSGGANTRIYHTAYAAVIRDMLGAEFHIDIDPFSGTGNHLEYSGAKSRGDLFGYHYSIEAVKAGGFLRYSRIFPKGSAYISASGSYVNTSRFGYFTNERYPENSSGKGDPVQLFGISCKAGGIYKLNGRHIFSLDLAAVERIPDLKALYLNPRENHITAAGVTPEIIRSADMRYRMDLPRARLRSALYYSDFSNLNEVTFYYYDGGVGNAFVREFSKGAGQVHYGGELSLEYDLTTEVKLDLVAAHGVYRYTSDPEIIISFNTVNEEEPINTEGTFNLGSASLKGLYLPQGPQSAVSVGINYRAPDYWWVGAVASGLDRNYLGISRVRRTESFFRDPETGDLVTDIPLTAAKELLRQEKLQPIYYLDLNGGKSWLIRDLYVSVFLSVNNLFNAVYETGGYEQNRNANLRDLYDDALGGSPSFGPKYWYGSGRTYFINLAFNF